jgi:hypothetical protein
MSEALMRRIIRAALRAARRVLGRSSAADDAEPSELMRNRVAYENELDIKPNGTHVVFYTMVPWVHSHIEYTLGKIFQYNGYHVTHVICGGELPVCGMENRKTKRPACSGCMLGAERFPHEYGAEYRKVNEIVDPAAYADLRSRLQAMSTDELHGFSHEEAPYGRLCLDDYTQFAHDRYELADMVDAEARATWEKGIVSQVILHDAVKKLNAELPHKIAVVSNGKSYAYTGLYQALRQAGIDTITWDETPVFYNSFLFKENDYANEIHIEDLFERQAKRLDGIAYRAAVDRYFKLWVEEGHHTFKYYSAPISEIERIEGELGVRFGDYERVVTLYTNVVWDTAVLTRDRAFAGLVDWVESFVRAAGSCPRTLLLIRAHPAEDKVPEEVRTVSTVRQKLLSRIGELPANVHVIPGASEISSYKLFEISDANVVYTTTVGLEMALRGFRPYVGGLTHYAEKGFTTEIVDRGQVLEILASRRADNRLCEEERDRAYRYAYLWLFVSQFRPFNLPRSRDVYHLDEYARLVSTGSEYYRLYQSMVSHETYAAWEAAEAGDPVAPGATNG